MHAPLLWQHDCCRDRARPFPALPGFVVPHLDPSDRWALTESVPRSLWYCKLLTIKYLCPTRMVSCVSWSGGVISVTEEDLECSKNKKAQCWKRRRNEGG